MKQQPGGVEGDIQIMRELRELSRGSYETAMDQFRSALRKARERAAAQGDSSQTLKIA